MDPLINNSKQNRTLYVVLAIYLVIFVYGFLFLRQAGIGNRILTAVWDLGHVLGFATLMVFVFKLSTSYARLSLIMQFLLAWVSASLLGLLIEFIQSYTGRSFSLNDVLLNLIGVTIGIAFFSPGLKSINRRVAILIRTIVFISLLVIYRDAMIFAYDGYESHQQFPVLLELSSPFELTRWRGHHVRYSRLEFEQKKVLKAEFKPARYATLTFDHFPRDWSGYKYIEIVAYNPEDSDVKLDIRVHDLAHVEHKSEYSDRFNSNLMLKPGWNTSKILLEEIKNAPRKRQMDMRHIHQVIFFFPNLTIPRTILFREIRLTG